MVFEDLYKKTCFLKMTSFFQKKTCFFQKNLAKKQMFFMVDQTKQKLLLENYECFSKKKNVKGLFLLKTLTWASYGYRYSPYEPGFNHSILKISVVNAEFADLLFAKYGKLTTR